MNLAVVQRRWVGVCRKRNEMEKSETAARESHAKGMVVGTRMKAEETQRARKEHQFLELSLTIRGLSD